jgi:3-deoxy-D-manno-octulosonic-acid transferase
MQNFASLAEAFLRAGGAMRVSDAGELQEAVDTLLHSPTRRQESTRAAQHCLAVHRGATLRTIDLLNDLLRKSSAEA